MGSRLSQIARFHRHNLQHPPRPPAVLRSTPDCRPRRVLLHLSYSYAPSYSDGTRDTRPTADSCIAAKLHHSITSKEVWCTATRRTDGSINLKDIACKFHWAVEAAMEL